MRAAGGVGDPPWPYIFQWTRMCTLGLGRMEQGPKGGGGGEKRAGRFLVKNFLQKYILLNFLLVVLLLAFFPWSSSISSSRHCTLPYIQRNNTHHTHTQISQTRHTFSISLIPHDRLSRLSHILTHSRAHTHTLPPCIPTNHKRTLIIQHTHTHSLELCVWDKHSQTHTQTKLYTSFSGYDDNDENREKDPPAFSAPLEERRTINTLFLDRWIVYLSGMELQRPSGESSDRRSPQGSPYFHWTWRLMMMMMMMELAHSAVLALARALCAVFLYIRGWLDDDDKTWFERTAPTKLDEGLCCVWWMELTSSVFSSRFFGD